MPASVLCLGGFAPLAAAPARPDTVEAAERVRGYLTDHVVVISIDGLRPDAIDRFGAGTLRRLMREGSYTLQARTILPSKTLPSHTSMLTGVEPEDHGITWNTDETDTHGVVESPTIFSMARERGFSTAAFFSKTKFHHLEVPRSLDHVQSPQTGKWTYSHTLDNVEEYLEEGSDPNLMFVHIGEPDYAGHLFGWMSGRYGDAVRTADRAVAAVLRDADEAFGEGEYTVIVTADHGGHGMNHGSADPRDVTIPWIAWGKGVQGGTELPAGIRTMDTAATALWLLGVQFPADGDGRPVVPAFTTE